jgi:2-hydroxy-3-oxopropionate reductase
MTTVGFVGLGIMGLPMAANLVQAGFDVAGYNRSKGKADQLAERGGRAAGAVAEAVRDADVGTSCSARAGSSRTRDPEHW